MTRRSVSDAVRDRVMQIEERHGGRLNPADVVEDAKNPSSPLHGLFTWNVEEASKRYWLAEARAIIASVRIVRSSPSTQRVRAVYYIRDPSKRGNEPGYVSIPTLLSDSDLTRQAVVNELDQAANMLRRTRALAAVLDETEEMDALIDQVEQTREAFIQRRPKKRSARLRVAR